MIYVKKKNLIQRTIRIIKKGARGENISFAPFKCIFGAFKNIKNLLVFSFSVLSIFLIALYSSYLFALPKIITEQRAEGFINDFISKNTKLCLDIEDLKILPDWKFDINIKAKSIKLKYKDKNFNFITLENPDIDLNIAQLLFKNVDFRKIKLDKIEINSNFSNKKYDCFNYFSSNFEAKYPDFKLQSFKIESKEFLLNIFDKDQNKTFATQAKNIKLEKITNLINSTSRFVLSFEGNIKAKDGKKTFKISDYKLKLNIKTSKNPNAKNILKKLEKLDYNPFLMMYLYKTNCSLNANLKADLNSKNPKLFGEVGISDLTFVVNNLQMPKNSMILTFKGDKVVSDFDFNFINNQFVKINSIFNFNKKSYLELNLKTSSLDLSKTMPIILVFSKIINISLNPEDFKLEGNLSANVHLKSNFKTITSFGSANLSSGAIFLKKTGLKIEKINSKINFKDNFIDILSTSAYLNGAKFELLGKIDQKTNLNLKVQSDLIDLSKILNSIKPLLKIAKNNEIQNLEITSGQIKVNSSIKGTLKEPLIEAYSTLKNLKGAIKKEHLKFSIEEINVTPKIENLKLKYANVSIKNLSAKYKKYPISSQKINFLINEKEIKLEKSKISLDGLYSFIQGKIENYSDEKKTSANLDINADLSQKNSFIVFNKKNLNFEGNIIYKNNELNLNNCSIKNGENKIAKIEGQIKDFFKQDPIFNKLKISTKENVSLTLPILDNMFLDANYDITLSGKMSKLSLDGVLNISNLKYPKYALYLSSVILNFKNSACQVSILQGQIFNDRFDLLADIKYLNNKIIVSFAQFSSNFIDLDKLEKFVSYNSNSSFDIQIDNIKGNVLALQSRDFLFTNVYFEGNFKNDILNLKTFKADTLQGKLEGALKINTKNQKINADILAKNINVRLLSSKLKELSIAASGKLSALLRVEFMGYDLDSITKSIEGLVKFNINNGELSQFAKLERFLQAGNILSSNILKLSLNSTLSAVSRKNTGDFNTLEGSVKIQNSWANIQYLKTSGTNMSLFVIGRFNLINQYANLDVLGRIPSSMVSFMGNFGQMTAEKLIDKMSDDTKEIIKSLAQSPFQKMFSTQIPDEEISKIPNLSNQAQDTETREFKVKIIGNPKELSSIKNFKWRAK